MGIVLRTVVQISVDVEFASVQVADDEVGPLPQDMRQFTAQRDRHFQSESVAQHRHTKLAAREFAARHCVVAASLSPVRYYIWFYIS